MWTSWFYRQWDRVLHPKQIAIFEACIVGLISAIAAVSLKQAIFGLEAWRGGLTSTLPAIAVLPLLGIVGGGLSGFLVEKLAPEATGSGIPQVKAALGYVPIALDLRVAIVKWLGTCLSVGSGLALGRQGPTVQIGAALAAQLSKWTNTSPTYQRQLIAAGAAAGLAASFNAPIAGVLFVIEELLQDLPDLTLGTAIIAAAVGGIISRGLGGRGLIPDISNFSISFATAEIPLLIVVGILAGLLGALCNRSFLASLQFYQTRFQGQSLTIKVAVAGGISGILVAILPYGILVNSDLKDFLIVGNIQWQAAGWILIGQFLLCLVAFGSTAPGGILAPSLVLGAALGDLVATGMQSAYHSGFIPVDLVLSSPTVYALTGMSAVFSGITRRPMTAIAIVWEMTAKFDLVLPLMIGSVVAYLVAEKLFPDSLYQHLLVRRGINIEQPDLVDQRWEGLTAADIMQRQVETLASTMTINEAIQAFSQSHHRGFPIIEAGILTGMLTQSDLASLKLQPGQGEQPLSTVMIRRVITANPEDPLTSVLHLLNHHQISRLPVIDGRKLLGIITRADIIRCEAERVSSNVSLLKTQPRASYLVYQTRSPATGKGRLLVPLSNPQTADLIMQLAIAIAQAYDYEIECLHSILVPSAQLPAETSVDTTFSRQLLERAAAQGKAQGVLVHTQVRVAHDPATTILEIIRERHIDLLCMGWHGKTTTPGRIFGDTVDVTIRQVTCPVLLIKPGVNSRLERWLVPIAGGSNAKYALELLPAMLTASPESTVQLCQCFAPKAVPNLRYLNAAASFVKSRSKAPISLLPLTGEIVAAKMIKLAAKQACDVIVIGASRESLLTRAIQGNIPEEIARGSDCTVIVVRKALAN
jgi:chloride channel protein, CIC family